MKVVIIVFLATPSHVCWQIGMEVILRCSYTEAFSSNLAAIFFHRGLADPAYSLIFNTLIFVKTG